MYWTVGQMGEVKHQAKKTFVRWLICICISLMVLCWYLPAAVSEEEDDTKMEFIFFFPDTTVQNPVDATNALRTYMDIVNKKKGWNLVGYFFKKQRDLDNFLETHDVELGVFSPLYMIENQQKWKLVPFAAPMRNGKQTYRKTIIVRKEDNYRDIHDLKGKVLAATALGEDNIPFYNKIVFKGEIDIENHFSETMITDSLNSAILAVLYKKADAAAVALKSFDIVRELNPLARKQLTTIFTSDEIPISALCYFEDNFDTSLLPELKELLMTQHLDPVGQQSFLAFNVEAWAETSMKDYEETARLIKEYDQKVGKQSTPPRDRESGSSTPSKAEVKPTPVPEKPVRKFQIYRQGEETVVFSVKLSETVSATKATLFYTINKEPEKSLAMGKSGPTDFQVILPLPEVKTGGAETISYTVRPGDTLAKIARKYLGSTKKYMLIARLNNIKNPNVIYVDQELRIKTGDVSLTEVSGRVTIQSDKGELTTAVKKQTFF